jgi:hypothetical protein
MGDNSTQTNSGSFSYQISYSVKDSVNEASRGFSEAIHMAEKA